MKMRFCTILFTLGLIGFLQLIGTSVAKPCGSKRPRPVKLCRTADCGGIIGDYIDRSRGDYINADTDAFATGDFTDSYGNSRVNVDSLGNSHGSLDHGAKGIGRGHTSAHSKGRINSGNIFGGNSIGSRGSAQAFGTHSSISETRGHARSFNGFGGAGSSSLAAGSGYGQSSSRTSASSYRKKRHAGGRLCGFIGGCGSSINAETRGQAVGTLTNSFGRSDVGSDSFGSRGSVDFGAQGWGLGHTGANSAGRIQTNGPYRRSSVSSGAEAEGFGNLGSHSVTRGNAASHNNGFRHSGAFASVRSHGFGYSHGRSAAQAKGY